MPEASKALRSILSQKRLIQLRNVGVGHWASHGPFFRVGDYPSGRKNDNVGVLIAPHPRLSIITLRRIAGSSRLLWIIIITETSAEAKCLMLSGIVASGRCNHYGRSTKKLPKASCLLWSNADFDMCGAAIWYHYCYVNGMLRLSQNEISQSRKRISATTDRHYRSTKLHLMCASYVNMKVIAASDPTECFTVAIFGAICRSQVAGG